MAVLYKLGLSLLTPQPQVPQAFPIGPNVYSICLYYQIRFTIVKRVNSSSGMTFRLPLPPLPFAPVS